MNFTVEKYYLLLICFGSFYSRKFMSWNTISYVIHIFVISFCILFCFHKTRNVGFLPS